MAKGEEAKAVRGRGGAKESDFGHEVWGLIYVAMAVLVLIALVSEHYSRGGNILGQYLGSALATGLVYLFGRVPSFFFPAAVGYLGWQRLRGDRTYAKPLLFWLLLTLEICVFLAIEALPRLAAGKSMPIGENWIGIAAVKLMKPLFGPHTFGPYFITVLALVITALLSFRLSLQRIGGAVVAAARWLAARVVPLLRRMRASFRDREPLPKEAPQHKRKPPKEEAAITAAATAPAVIAAASSQTATAAAEKAADPVEEERRRLFEQELAVFRAKKRDPIQIMTVETPEVETDEPQIDESRIRDDGGETRATVKESRRKRAASDGAGECEPPPEEASADPVKPYEVPSPSILPDPPPLSSLLDKDAIEVNSSILEKTLANFGVEGKVVAVSPGPVVTRYEIVLAPGVKISKVVNLHNDISMAVGGQPIRIEAPIPGKSAVGIELPNPERQIVYFKHVLVSDVFSKSKAKLPVVIGTNISGSPYVADIFKMPHVLIAGQTGSGKSVCINSIICSLLMTKKPEEMRLIMIDPKKVELSFYEGIPHLLSSVVTESKEAVKALHWGVGEMERRYRLLAKVGARNIDSFNSRTGSAKFRETLPEEDNKPLPFIVILVDELADLMTKASKDVEALIQRIAQLARAVGIHLIVATQRPSVDIVTGPIKANLTSRIAFRTIQGTDSRTILDQIGAEKLLGMGDMLFLRNGAPQVERFHGAFISEEDVERVVTEIRKQEVRIDKIASFTELMGGDDDEEGIVAVTDGTRDELFEDAARMIVETGLGSTSLLQRRLNLGYARAGRIMDQLHDAGIVGPPNGSKAREVIARIDELDDVLAMLRSRNG